MADIKVPLERRFSPITPNKDDKEFDDGWLDAYRGLEGSKTWEDLEAEHRVVILANAGAGKTYETLNRAKFALEQGRTAFFIRIEDMGAHFEEAFEVGSSDEFDTWLFSPEEAWFFLDSVDEARLHNPGDFEGAIRRFARRIRSASHRAHVVITSRPYAWRFKSDKDFVEQQLPFALPQQNASDGTTSENRDREPASSVRVYGLQPLGVEDIRQFAEHLGTPDTGRLINEIQRANLLEVVSRPFDLEGLLLRWKTDGMLGSRLESLQRMIDIRLDEIDPGRSERQPLNQGKAREGARLLAAAVTLSGETGIRVPDSTHEKTGIDAKQVLAKWEPNDVRVLLERGIFNDILYGAVRFRHRETRELLTAEWLHSLLEKGNSRRRIESLLFREQYGEQVIVPRLKPVLPWLILFDESIRGRALALHPETAVEGGDAAHLPLRTRKDILNDIVTRIVADEDDYSARDNSAIARIAQQDLLEDVQRLIEKYKDNDDAIFFLGRLVWQGDMKDCLALLQPIAADPNRGIYPRIASARAVSTVGTLEQTKSLWEKINNQPDTIPSRLLAELIIEAATDKQTTELLITSIDKLPPYQKYEASGLDQALHLYLDRLAELPAHAREPLLTRLCIGFNDFLDREPHQERCECRVSINFIWLMEPANHAAEILVAGRADACFGDAVMGILLKIPAVKHWLGVQFDEHKGKLQQLIPVWMELNDALFWRSIHEARAGLAEQGKRLTEDWPVQWPGHYWRFETKSFTRIVDSIRTRESEDDQLVALSLAFRIYDQAERPTDWKTFLHEAAKGNDALEKSLHKFLNPSVCAKVARSQQEDLEYEQEQEKKRQERECNRSRWIEKLRANPDVLRNPPQLPPGMYTEDQIQLCREICFEHERTSLGKGLDWQFLIDEFGEPVASAFRDAAMKHWRFFQPELRSEGADTESITYPLIFAMMGLEFESREVENFPRHLNDTEVSHALRYLTRELNGFPSWLEIMYWAYPDESLESVWRELHWELENTLPDKPMNYILHNIVYHAPWLHKELTPYIQSWIDANPQADYHILPYCLQILHSSEVEPDWFATLAQSKISMAGNTEDTPAWYALWVDAEPETGIADLEARLESMGTGEASQSAQKFITQLLGKRRDQRNAKFIQNFKTVANLKKLYLLMHRHIRVEDDIDRTGTGAYSPELRDDAQDARDRLLNLLVEIPGKQSYVALSELGQSHPVASLRPWVAKLVRTRAEQDADLEPWTESQIHDFSSQLEREPTSHRQLFDIGVLHLNDFKEWLEYGNDSLFATYRRIDNEKEMRMVVANWINRHAHGRYTCSQENPLANDQQPDIWLQSPQVGSPVPIELKLLDRGWSGPKLCERLRNQLAGDYLREETADCGIFLLVWQGKQAGRRQAGRRWEIEGRRVGVSELQPALTNYWNGISSQFPNVSAIEVIVVDLTLRAKKSET